MTSRFVIWRILHLFFPPFCLVWWINLVQKIFLLLFCPFSLFQFNMLFKFSLILNAVSIHSLKNFCLFILLWDSTLNSAHHLPMFQQILLLSWRNHFCKFEVVLFWNKIPGAWFWKNLKYGIKLYSTLDIKYQADP